MINVVQNGEVYEITFPYDIGIITLIKNVPGRRWNSAGKMWTVPKDRLGFFIKEFQGTRYEPLIKIHSDEEINQNAELGTTQDIPDIDISDVTFHVKDGSTPYQHQLDFMKWAIARQRSGNMDGFICADEMGLSKTIEAANLAIYNKERYGFNHCLIICCVNSVKYHWQDDIKQHTKGEYVPYILGSRLRRDGSVRCDGGSKDKYDDLVSCKMYNEEDGEDLPYFIIVNIEAFRYRSGKTHLFTDKIIELINSGYISMVILDEVHKNCFTYDTPVLTDAGYQKIGDIVSQHLSVNVCSYNIASKQFEWRPICNRFQINTSSPLIQLTLSTESGIKQITCTADHEFYTSNRGWVAAKNLTNFDNIVEVDNDKDVFNM